ncbi:uncharacterized protein LOC116661531 [Camelus ferus]|uniref:Uncharacterized protein LOC116661531 n=1 Tax=Camelus ferus TaxID=419612 RepID=A0A8B8SK04_CAMFR|nr:uncharacterized protein LOC116661531 [Camelus ferus]
MRRRSEQGASSGGEPWDGLSLRSFRRGHPALPSPLDCRPPGPAGQASAAVLDAPPREGVGAAAGVTQARGAHRGGSVRGPEPQQAAHGRKAAECSDSECCQDSEDREGETGTETSTGSHGSGDEPREGVSERRQGKQGPGPADGGRAQRPARPPSLAKHLACSRWPWPGRSWAAAPAGEGRRRGEEAVLQRAQAFRGGDAHFARLYVSNQAKMEKHHCTILLLPQKSAISVKTSESHAGHTHEKARIAWE